MASIVNNLLTDLPDGKVVEVTVGLFMTAVVVDSGGASRCGLAATLKNPEFEHAQLAAVRDSGQLEGGPAMELASWVSSDSFTEAGVGLATINALLPTPTDTLQLSAEDYISKHGEQARVALIGHFPFVPRLKTQVKELWVLELDPQDGDLPTSSAAQIIPQADILAITATTLINHSFDGLFALRRHDARVILLGPSTPLSPRLFDMGIHVLSGSVIEDAKKVLTLVQQGATFHQIKNHGVRLVTLEAPKATP